MTEIAQKPREPKLSALVGKISPSKTMAMNAAAARMKAAGRDVISLSAGELASNTPASAKNAGLKAIEQNKTRYTLNTGTVELREAICAKYRDELGLNYSSDQVIVSNGAKQVIYNLLLALCGPGDEVIVFSPYWVSYPEQIALTGATMVDVPTTIKDGFQVSPERLLENMNVNTRMVIINSPNNPTGAVYDEGTLREVARICAERNVWLLSDEIYEKIIFPPHTHFSPAQESAEAYQNTLIVNGFSKTYAMTGWRIGYALGPTEVIKAAAKIQSHTTSNACSIAQSAALGALEGDNSEFFGSLIPELIGNRDLALEIIDQTNLLSASVPLGAFYIMADVSALFGKIVSGAELKCAADVSKFILEELEVSTTPGEAFGSPNCIRISYSADRKLIEKGMRRIQKGLNAL
ncbi:MAG: pyridoxal phosphate-dependent aminotransferase [candidate division Zixibacteria bacterium]|nr:pyridoxal phosphate-dependent aminotransferase [candidate division Zixibacteria bacterium]